MNHVIVGVDGSDGAARALDWAYDETQRHHWDVTAAFTFERHSVDGGGLDKVMTEAKARRMLDMFVVTALGNARAEKLDCQVRCDLAGPALVDLAVDAALLVVGARGRGPVARLLLGSVSEYCLHHATCPVAVIRPWTPREATTRRRIVVGVDGSENAREALSWAVREATVDQAQLEVVHAWNAPYYVDPLGLPAIDPRVFEDAARATLDTAASTGSVDVLEEPMHRVLVQGAAASALLDAAQDADLLVVGSRGMGGFRELLLGSVSHQVAHHATCPVVVVPSKDRA